jgi:hypothetical protein
VTLVVALGGTRPLKSFVVGGRRSCGATGTLQRCDSSVEQRSAVLGTAVLPRRAVQCVRVRFPVRRVEEVIAHDSTIQISADPKQHRVLTHPHPIRTFKRPFMTQFAVCLRATSAVRNLIQWDSIYVLTLLSRANVLRHIVALQK